MLGQLVAQPRPAGHFVARAVARVERDEIAENVDVRVHGHFYGRAVWAFQLP